MAKAALLIMAAGLGSRFKGGIKQMTPVDSKGRLLLDYDVYDAVCAGFEKIIIVLRRDILADFNSTVGRRLSKYADVQCCVQDLDDLPQGFSVPQGRKKPWGTGHAVLAARELISEPFVIIGADDYFGKLSFANAYSFLTSKCTEREQFMSGYVLKNTLSESGTVTRAICSADENGRLIRVEETYNLARRSDGRIFGERNGMETEAAENSLVSMNMWGFHQSMVKRLEDGFRDFLAQHGEEMTSEYLLPSIVDGMIKSGDISVNVVRTDDKWFGITHSEDCIIVKRKIEEMKLDF